LHEKGVCFSFYEVAWAQRRCPRLGGNCKGDGWLGADCGWVDAFIRDELSKGRYDPGVSRVCFEMLLELFGRTLKVDLGERVAGEKGGEDVC